MMPLRHFLDDGQTETGAVARRALDAVEPFENPPARGFRNTWPRIFDTQVRVTELRTTAHGHCSSTGCIAKCVIEEIVEQLLEQRRVSGDVGVLEDETEVDIARDRALHPFVDRAVRDCA